MGVRVPPLLPAGETRRRGDGRRLIGEDKGRRAASLTSLFCRCAFAEGTARATIGGGKSGWRRRTRPSSSAGAPGGLEGHLADPQGDRSITTGMVFIMVFLAAMFFLVVDQDHVELGRSARASGRGLKGGWRMRWYVIHVYSGFEKKVAESIKEQAARRAWRTCSRRSWCRPRKWSRCAAAAEGQCRAQVLPRLRAGQDGDDRRDLAPGQEHAEGDRLPRRPATSRRRSPTEEAERILHQVQEGVERPKPSITFEIGEQVRVSDGPFTSFNGWSRRSTRKRRGSRSRCRSSAARRRSSWNTAGREDSEVSTVAASSGRWRRPAGAAPQSPRGSRRQAGSAFPPLKGR